MAHTLLTDAELRARDALGRSAIYVLREIEVDLDGDALMLTGMVDSFYHKQLAQEIVKGVADGLEVVNALRVVYNRERPAPATAWG
jgi:osmotically-inducible protein OsmY